MRRRRVRLLTLLWLAPLLVLAALWARSAYAGDQWTLSVPGWRFQVRSDWGRLSFALLDDSGADWDVSWDVTGGGYAGSLPGRPTSPRRKFLGISYVSGTFTCEYLVEGAATPVTVNGRYWWVQLYHPHVLAPLLMPAAPLSCRHLRSKRRAARGRCRHCGYDLRASGDRCPECGTLASSVAPR